MDKQNIFRSCSFHADAGDVVHVLIKDLTGSGFALELSDADGNTEDETEVTPAGELYMGTYGALYNWYAAVDVKNIASAGWHMPTNAEWQTLSTFLGGAAIAGGKLKETGIIHWSTPNTGATNEVGFNGRASGRRQYSNGLFYFLGSFSASFWTSTPWGDGADAYMTSLSYNSTNLVMGGIVNYKQGSAIRLLKDSTTLTHGQTGYYVGNNGVVYNTICIGTQEWMSQNIAETKFRDGSLIPIVTDNTAWTILVTSGMCYYDNTEV